MRLAKRRLSIVYAADAVGDHDDEKEGQALLRDAEREGAAAVELARRFPDVISALRLGSFGEGGLRPFLLRRMLLWLRVPPGLLASLGTLAGRRRRLAWFRFVHAFAYWTGVRRTVDRSTWNALTTSVTILMYHAIGGDGEAPSRYTVPIRRFRRQVRWLRLLRYRVVTVAQLAEWRRDGVPPPRRCVAVTFDDGYADNLELAAPVLRRARLRATLYLVAGAHDQNDWDDVGQLAGRRIAPASAFAADDVFEDRRPLHAPSPSHRDGCGRPRSGGRRVEGGPRGRARAADAHIRLPLRRRRRACPPRRRTCRVSRGVRRP